MERTAKVHEKYDAKTGEYVFKGVCPFDGKDNVMSGGEFTKKCKHLVGERHGCGGTIFVFKERADKAA